MKKGLLILLLLFLAYPFIVSGSLSERWLEVIEPMVEDCQHNNLSTDGKCWVLVTTTDEVESLVHRIYNCDKCNKEVLITNAVAYPKQPEITLDLTSTSLIIEPNEPKKPYLHKNPNNDHWVCSKHGDLEPDSPWVCLDMTTVTFGDSAIAYCHKCFWEQVNIILGQYITGAKL